MHHQRRNLPLVGKGLQRSHILIVRGVDALVAGCSDCLERVNDDHLHICMLIGESAELLHQAAADALDGDDAAQVVIGLVHESL